MATTTNNKKYYWLKLKEDFFDDDTINWIEEQENGKEYCLFYLKLCLKSLKTNGVLIRNVGQMLIPYDVKKLAEITNTPADTVRVAMEVFKNIGLIQILENGEIYMAQLKNMVGSETKWAEKKRLQREKEKEKLPAPEKGQTGDNVPTMSDRDRERDKEKEKEKEKETNRQTNSKEIEEEPLTEEDLDHIELLKGLLASWPVNNNQILFIYQTAKDQIPFELGMRKEEYDIRIYDGLHRLIMRAKADGVTYIYRWLIKMIPLEIF